MNPSEVSGPGGAAHRDENPVPVEVVRAAIGRILASRSFQSSDTLSRFLRYTVEQTLEGHTGKLKEYSLGVDVLGRSPSFDPRIDSIVRVEASRLRARLAEYYRTEGCDDAIRIELPKGSYAPRFRTTPPAPEPKVPPKAAGSRWALWVAAGLAIATCIGAASWLAAGSVRGFRTLDAQAPLASLAVLPFVSFGSESDSEHLADGVTEEITNTLARIPGLRVVARSSAFQFKGGKTDVREVGRRLGVAKVLEGSVRKAGDRLRITAQLVNTADGYHLWSESYERRAGEISAIQSNIVHGVAGQLQLKLATESGLALLKRETTSSEAYNLVLKARYGVTENSEERLTCYRRALEYDPQYANAWLGVADELMSRTAQGTVAPRQVIGEARNAIGKALQLDDGLPGAHFLLAMTLWNYDWDWPGADREFARALDLNPNSAPTRIHYARYLALMGRREEALHQLERTRILDPISAAMRSVEVPVYYLTGDYDRTIEHARAVLAGDPKLWLMYYWMGRAYDSKGMLPEAISALEKWHGIPGNLQGRGFGMLGSAYARAGRRADAMQILESAIDRSKRVHVSPSSVALIHIGLGDFDTAMEWLEKAYVERDQSMVSLKADPVYRPLRGNTKFVALVRRMKLD